MSSTIIGRIDEMGNRIDDLEKSIAELMQQVSPTNNSTLLIIVTVDMCSLSYYLRLVLIMLQFQITQSRMQNDILLSNHNIKSQVLHIVILVNNHVIILNHCYRNTLLSSVYCSFTSFCFFFFANSSLLALIRRLEAIMRKFIYKQKETIYIHAFI